MAEPDSLMQLGIEAARDGNKEEARNLFRLLTIQDPTNAQAWLWLAGVAENREERQAALERVVELDPKNEMALKGLQALGVRPNSRAATPAPVEEPVPAPASPASSIDDDPFGGDDDPFAALNDLSDIMANEAPVRRTEPTPVRTVESDTDSVTTTGAAVNRPVNSGRPPKSNRRTSVYDDEDVTVPARKGSNPLRTLILGLIGLLVIGLLLAMFFLRQSSNVADQQSPQQTAAAATSQAAIAVTTPTVVSVLGNEGVGTTTEPITATVIPELPTAAPTAAAAVVAPADVSQANPVIVGANTPLQSENWLYDFNQPTYAAPIIGPLGQYQPNNGRFVVVLAFVVNNTGTSQAIPANFFVLKDAQGRVWEARPEVSEAYVIPGMNADLSQTQAVPTDGLTRSVALIFDVAPDATNLVFFARSNSSQGWMVLSNV